MKVRIMKEVKYKQMKKNKFIKLHLSSVYGQQVEKNIGQHTKYKRRRFSKFYSSIFRTLMHLNFVLSINDDKRSQRYHWLMHVFYPKWVLGECHNLCRRCEYKNECYSNIESEE